MALGEGVTVALAVWVAVWVGGRLGVWVGGVSTGSEDTVLVGTIGLLVNVADGRCVAVRLGVPVGVFGVGDTMAVAVGVDELEVQIPNPKSPRFRAKHRRLKKIMILKKRRSCGLLGEVIPSSKLIGDVIEMGE